MAIKPYGIPKDDALVEQKGPISATKLPSSPIGGINPGIKNSIRPTGMPTPSPLSPTKKPPLGRPDPLPKPEVFERTVVKKPSPDLSKPQVQPGGAPKPGIRPTGLPQTQPTDSNKPTPIKPTGLPVRKPGFEPTKEEPGPGFAPISPTGLPNRKPDDPVIKPTGPIRPTGLPANTGPGTTGGINPGVRNRNRPNTLPPKARPRFNGGYGSQVTPGAFNMRDNLNRNRNRGR